VKASRSKLKNRDANDSNASFANRKHNQPQAKNVKQLNHRWQGWEQNQNAKRNPESER